MIHAKTMRADAVAPFRLGVPEYAVEQLQVTTEAFVEKQLELEARLLGELDDSAKIAIGVQVARPMPDVSHLTPAQLFAQQRVLREARAKLDAIEAGEIEPCFLLEAGAATVEEV